MTVPAHNLYDFIHLCLENRYWLWYFYPFGEKNLCNAIPYQTGPNWLRGARGLQSSTEFYNDMHHKPTIFCHDQEPLGWDLYEPGSVFLEGIEQRNMQEFGTGRHDMNLRSVDPLCQQKRWILLHSEVNSDQLDRYEQSGAFLSAYWWSHAMLSLDWYRFAQHDTALGRRPRVTVPFLMYCRDTSGSRRYRQDFLDALKDDPCCQIGSFHGNTVDASASAEYDVEDITRSDFSIILETIFESQRTHLTEKTCRALACGHPFLLAAGPGSLSLLRHYGFETYAPWIDESYDRISDPAQRGRFIINEVKRLSRLPPCQYQTAVDHCRAIAQANQKRFFSTEFREQIIQELRNNTESAAARL